MSDREATIRWGLLAAGGTALAVLIAALFIWGQPVSAFLGDQEQVRAWVVGYGPWGPLAVILLEMAQTLLAPIPGTAIEAASGYLFGPWMGAFYAMTGIAAGSSLSFVIARRFGRPLLRRLASEQTVARLDDLAQRGGSLFFFLLWLFPFVPDDLACLAAGLTPMPFHRFLGLMVVGRLPGILFSVWIGANAARFEPIWWGLALIGIAAVALILWRWGNRLEESALDVVERLSQRLQRS